MKMKFVYLSLIITIFVIPYVFLNTIYAETLRKSAYEIEREYWKNRKDLSQRERLKKMDEAHTKHYGDSGGGSEAAFCCVAVILFIGTAVFLSVKEQQQINELSAIANENGFNIENEYKICPKCAELIKLQAEKCKHCGKSFSAKENQDVLKKTLESYIENSKSK